MSTSRDFPFSFSPEARLVLGPPDALNSAVRAAFPALEDGWAGRTASFFPAGLCGPTVVARSGSHFPAGSALGLFAGTVFMGDVPRGDRVLALPSFRVNGCEVRCYVDGSSRAARRPTGAEAVLYRHVCDDDDATVVGDWWLDGPVPCLVARAAAPLGQFQELCWNFDLHGAARYTMSHAEARQWRREGHRTARCACNVPRDCPFDRYLRLADASSSSDDSDW